MYVHQKKIILVFIWYIFVINESMKANTYKYKRVYHIFVITLFDDENKELGEKSGAKHHIYV